MKTNEFTVTGNLGNIPEIKTTTSGKKLATFSLAETITYKDDNGQKQKKKSMAPDRGMGKIS